MRYRFLALYNVRIPRSPVTFAIVALVCFCGGSIQPTAGQSPQSRQYENVVVPRAGEQETQSIRDSESANDLKNPGSVEVSPDRRPQSILGTVKVVLDERNNTITLVGSPNDIAIVRRSILAIQEETRLKASVTTKKILLKFQMAETVEPILKSFVDDASLGLKGLSIHALHHPEAILLSGPTGSVDQAAKMLDQLDSHPAFK